MEVDMMDDTARENMKEDTGVGGLSEGDYHD